MAAWGGVLKFDPSIGGSSIVRYDAANSPHPGGRSIDIAVAPDNTIWIAVFNVSSGLGGLVRYQQATNTWTWWGFNSSQNNWPGATSCSYVSVQPKPAGGYRVWLFGDVFTGVISYDSDTDLFTSYPYRSGAGDLDGLPGKDGVDDAGNIWLLRFQGFTQPRTLEYVSADSIWTVVPAPYSGATDEIHAFKAYGNANVLFANGNGDIWHYDGSSWTSYGQWRPGPNTAQIDIDAAGAIWVAGTGGAAKRDPQTGQWQRYRVTNTSQYDYFNSDFALDNFNNYVYASANAGPGIGGMTRFDGERWLGFNNFHYGLGIDWPFPTDNCDVVAVRQSNGIPLISPTGGEIYEWDGVNYTPLQYTGIVADITEDSQGRVWALGDYFDLQYYDGSTWISDAIQGFGNNIAPDPARPGAIWASAYAEIVNTDGSYRFSRTYDQFPDIDITHDILTTVAPDPDGTVWMGSTNGLFHIDPQTGNYDYYGTGNSNIPGDLVRPYVVSPDGRVWFANWNSLPPAVEGLCWFDGTDFGVFLVQPGGLPHKQIENIEMRLIPGGYELWMTCASQGIAVLSVTTPTGIDEEQPVTADGFNLLQNYPNPFNPSTTISFNLPSASEVMLQIFDITGRKVRTLLEGQVAPGTHHVQWDGTDEVGQLVASGMYFYQLKAGSGIVQTRKMILMR
ncbi:MAG: hypothetical protein Kow0042_23280 [Calditrichia bacterium]